MISAVLDKFKNALWYHPEAGTRKRPYCRDMDYSDDDDEDSDIDVVVDNRKRMRLEEDHPAEAPSQPFLWSPRLGRVAEWIVRTKTTFRDNYFFRSIMSRANSPLTERLQSKMAPKKDFSVVIVPDDSDNDEPQLLFEGSATNAHATLNSKSLVRPPLSRNSEIGLPSKEIDSSSFKRQDSPARKFRREQLSKQRASQGDTNSFRYRPVYEKFFTETTDSSRSFPKMTAPLNSTKTSQSRQHSTARESIRLDEHERYRRLLHQFSVVPPPPSSASEKSSSLESVARNYHKAASQHAASKKRSIIVQQKLDGAFSEGLKERLGCVNMRNETPSAVRWLHTSTPEIDVIERKPRQVLPDIKIIERKTKQSSSVLKEISPQQNESKDCYIVSPSNAGYCKLTQDQTLYESPYLKENWLNEKLAGYQATDDMRKKKIEKQTELVKRLEQVREEELRAKFQIDLTLKDIPLIEEDEEVTVVEKLPELTPEMLETVNDALRPNPPNEVLVDAFRLQVTRKDMETLSGLNWLNDEVVNFYFNMLIERGKLDNYPSVYSCNTFFYPKLLSNGHASLKRWTRKIDIFAHDLMLVPVHLGMHWCLAVVDFRVKKIKYYDSMGGDNKQCLNALKSYLEAESLDKKRQKLDTSDWELQTIKDKPNQLNGSDCGMFACKYAEYVCRDAEFTFTQEDMPYFRKRMVYEIVKGKLL